MSSSSSAAAAAGVGGAWEAPASPSSEIKICVSDGSARRNIARRLCSLSSKARKARRASLSSPTPVAQTSGGFVASGRSSSAFRLLFKLWQMFVGWPS